MKFESNMEFKCCFCGEVFEGYGNNPWPMADDTKHRCCNVCNMRIVVPARIEFIREKESGTEQSK